MARANRNGQKLQASYKALQNDLSAVVEDIEKMAASGPPAAGSTPARGSQ